MIVEVYFVSIFTVCIAFLLYLDDDMCAFRKKRGLVNWDWYFGERMETSNVCEKDTKRKFLKNNSTFLSFLIFLTLATSSVSID